MKKYILLLVLLIPINVFALYSPYSEYKYSKEEVLSDDLTEVKKIRQYKYYELEKEYSSEYLDAPNDKYNLKSEDYIIDSKITTDEDYNNDDGVLIEEKDYTDYKEHQKVRYIIFTNFVTNSKNLSIGEILVYKNLNERIEISITCESCSEEFLQTINNKNSFDSAVLPENSTIIVDLLDYYYPSDLRFYLVAMGTYKKNYSADVVVNKTGLIEDNYYKYSYTSNLSSYELQRFKLSDFNTNYKLEDDIKRIEGNYDHIDNAEIVNSGKIYSYYKKLFKYYRYKRVYLDSYYTNLDGYIKDEEKYIDLYMYRTRVYISEEGNDNTIYLEKEIPIYIEKEVPTYIEKVKEIPFYITKEVEKEKRIPIFIEKIKEVEIPTIETVEVPTTKVIDNTKKESYFVRYFLYLASYVILRKK